MTQHTHWHPTWWKEEHTTSWDRIREAVRRDWQQTKHDLHLGGHQLNQKVGDTVKQAAGEADIPSINVANPPKVIGDLSGEWERVEAPIEYGYAARREFGPKHREWNAELEKDLRREWESPKHADEGKRWDEVRGYVRRGYDYKV